MSMYSIELQDSEGNIYYLHTDATVVKCGDSNLKDILDTISININVLEKMMQTQKEEIDVLRKTLEDITFNK